MRPEPSLEAPGARVGLGLEWLVRLRWWSLAGQVATVAAARLLFGMSLPLLRLGAPVAVGVLSNAALAVAVSRGVRFSRPLCGAVLALDTLLLSALLHAAGGAANPFSTLYLVQITLAALLLGPRWTWSLAGLAAACYGLLFVTHVPLELEAGMASHGTAGFQAHLQGMWVAFGLATLLTAYFVTRLADAMERQERAAATLREEAAHHERQAALTTMAAGAAHELGTPLATIAVVAGELERALRDQPDAGPLVDDARLIRGELERCRRILDRLAVDAGAVRGEAPVPVPLGEIASEVADSLPEERRRRLLVETAAPDGDVHVPRRAVVQVVQSLLSNAFAAGPGPVRLSLRTADGRVRLEVRDEGAGMSPEVLARAGEPFFSTRPAGSGMGLGLFLARTLSEQMGGRLVLNSEPGRGTRACVELLPQAKEADA